METPQSFTRSLVVFYKSRRFAERNQSRPAVLAIKKSWFVVHRSSLSKQYWNLDSKILIWASSFLAFIAKDLIIDRVFS